MGQDKRAASALASLALRLSLTDGRWSPGLLAFRRIRRSRRALCPEAFLSALLETISLSFFFFSFDV